MPKEVNTSEFMATLAELFVISKTGADYCRSIVMDPEVGKHTVGAQLFTVNQNGDLVIISGFGKPAIPNSKKLSIWDDHLIASAIRENREAKGQVTNDDTGETFHVFVYPYRRPSNPVGMIVMVKTEDWAVVLEDDDQRTLSLMGALWLESLGIESSVSKDASPETLTDRQITILKSIAEGKTNAQIAQELILSESSIRQETVRIYRALGVASRAEASKRAIHQGLISRVAI